MNMMHANMQGGMQRKEGMKHMAPLKTEVAHHMPEGEPIVHDLKQAADCPHCSAGAAY